MQKIKELIDEGCLELATCNGSNPEKMDYSSLEQKVDLRNHMAQVSSKLSSLSKQQRVQWLAGQKLKANQRFKAGEYHKAIQVNLETLMGLDLSQKTQKQQFQYPILLNMATCYYHTGNYEKGVALCEVVLNQNKDHSMALYKKGCLLSKMGEYDQSNQCLHKAYDLSDDAMKQSIRIQLNVVKTYRSQQSGMYKKMFHKQRQEEEDETILCPGIAPQSKQSQEVAVPKGILGWIARLCPTFWCPKQKET